MTRVAVVHDFFVQEGGAERVALELVGMFPGCEVYTSFFDARHFGDRIDPARVHPWPMQRLVGPTRRFRSFLPFYPPWYSMLDLREFDLVVSSSVAFTHAVRTAPGARHLAYVHTPMRYAWDLDRYLEGSSAGRVSRIGGRVVRLPLQRWDRWASRRPDVLVANSKTVQARIRRRWHRASDVVYPPVDIDEITPGERDDGFLLVAARLLAYRRIDLAVDAATRVGRELVVVGDGPEAARLRDRAGPTVRFEGFVPRPRLVELMRSCHAYLVPGIEDFGIAPVEAMAAGRPVIAFGEGGAAETVVDGSTGVFFRRQSVDEVVDAIRAADATAWDPGVIRARAESFGPEAFRAGIRARLEAHPRS